MSEGLSQPELDAQIEQLLEHGLTPEERTKLDSWEHGFMDVFWNERLIPFLREQERLTKEACCVTGDADVWKLSQGKLAFIRSLLNMPNFIRSSYAQVALERQSELDEFLSTDDDEAIEDFG